MSSESLLHSNDAGARRAGGHFLGFTLFVLAVYPFGMKNTFQKAEFE